MIKKGILLLLLLAAIGDGRAYAQLQIGNWLIDTVTVSSGHEIITALDYGLDGRLYIAEQRGTVSVLEFDRYTRTEIFFPEDVYFSGEAGLIAMALHPDFLYSKVIFLYYTYMTADRDLVNKLVRYTLHNDQLIEPYVLLDGIPASQSENGAALATTPDGKLLLATGNANDRDAPQSRNTMNGKVLRINVDGSIPRDNPIPDNFVYSWGHASPKGIAWTPEGRFYEVESGPLANDQEVNMLMPGLNYGWPLISGVINTPAELARATETATAHPLFSYQSPIEVTGMVYYWQDSLREFKNSLLVTTGNAQTLIQLRLNEEGDSVVKENTIFINLFGRMSAITMSPEGAIFIGTANRILNGNPVDGDDRVIAMFPLGEISSRQYLSFEDLGAKIFPLPADTEVNLQFAEPPKDLRNIQLLDSRGQVVRTIAVTSKNIYTIPRNGLKKGTYVLKLEFYGYQVTDTVVFR